MPAIQQQTVKLVGELSEWSVRGADGWGTGTLAMGDGPVEVVGKLVGVRAGSTVELEGVWHEHPQYGRQLKVRRCTAARLDSTAGVVAWLASVLPDVGDNRARALVERFGDALWNVIVREHQRLAEVDGITPQRAAAIREAYLEHEAERVNMVQLRGWGLTDSQVARCVAAWGTLTTVVERVRANPYELSRFVHGFGFARADKVALKAGVAHDSPARIQACVQHVVEEAAATGHMFVAGAALQRMAVDLLTVSPAAVATAIKDVAHSGALVRHGWRIYTQRLDAAEEACAVGLARLTRARGAACH